MASLRVKVEQTVFELGEKSGGGGGDICAITREIQPEIVHASVSSRYPRRNSVTRKYFFCLLTDGTGRCKVTETGCRR